MRSSRVKLCLKFGLVLLSAVLIDALNPLGTRANPDLSRWREGDVIFLNGSSFRSSLVRALQKYSADYTHAGIVVVDHGDLFVVHADPAAGKVMQQRWDEMIASGSILGGAVFRVKHVDRSVLRSACATARRFADEALPFDNEFNLRTGDRLFCTELVLRAYRSAGVDLCPDAETNHPHLLPIDLAASTELELVLRF